MTNTVLIVEDNQKLSNYLESHLKSLGYTVSKESSGDIAVFRILKETPDLVLLDIMLPGMDGRQICKTVRNDYEGKIIMLTALGDIQDEVSGLNLGADDYLTKPIDPALLTARIQALMRRQHTPTIINKILFGELEINLITNEAFLAKERLNLKPTEFELLALLAKNADYVLSRDTIMLAIRGIPYDGIDRSIDLRVSYLRNKLEDNLEAPYRIKTIHGKGYVFVSSAWES